MWAFSRNVPCYYWIVSAPSMMWIMAVERIVAVLVAASNSPLPKLEVTLKVEQYRADDAVHDG